MVGWPIDLRTHVRAAECRHRHLPLRQAGAITPVGLAKSRLYFAALPAAHPAVSAAGLHTRTLKVGLRLVRGRRDARERGAYAPGFSMAVSRRLQSTGHNFPRPQPQFPQVVIQFRINLLKMHLSRIGYKSASAHPPPDLGG